MKIAVRMVIHDEAYVLEIESGITVAQLRHAALIVSRNQALPPETWDLHILGTSSVDLEAKIGDVLPRSSTGPSTLFLSPKVGCGR